MKWFQNSLTFVKAYCENCTIAGLCFIANNRLHFAERIFWLVFIIFSSYSAWHLMEEYQNLFDSKSISIVFENTSPKEQIDYPCISVCNSYAPDYSDTIEKFVESKCEECGPSDYDISLERQVELLTYPSLYSEGQFSSICHERVCDKCKGCVQEDSRRFLEEFNFNCTEIFGKCITGDDSFDCCTYFRPIIAPFGNCFLLNSLQNNNKDSKRWYHRKLIPGIDEIKIVVKKPVHKLTILNNDDIPNLITPQVSMSSRKLGKRKALQIEIKQTITDPDIHRISPENRKCRFPNEVLPGSIYKAYSFSACLSDCIRGHQMRLCNCSIQSLVPKANPKYPVCDLNGLYCLEQHHMIKPDARNLLPWSYSGTECKCPASCTEYSIIQIYDSILTPIPSKDIIEFIIQVPMRSEHSYRRQAIRTRLDNIVTIGGILGLFLGASLLSGAEVLYYFLLWFINITVCHASKFADFQSDPW